jgi:hypothetical protein
MTSFIGKAAARQRHTRSPGIFVEARVVSFGSILLPVASRDRPIQEPTSGEHAEVACPSAALDATCGLEQHPCKLVLPPLNSGEESVLE